MSTKANCWEVKRCGRQPGGDRAAELGVCPASTTTISHDRNDGDNGGRLCWAISGTLCGGNVQGSFAQKGLNCLSCDFFAAVKIEEGEQFRLLLADQPMEQVLCEVAERHRVLFDNLPAGLYRREPSGRFLEANAALLALLGYQDQEAITRLDAKELYVEQSDFDRWRSLMEARGEARDVEVRLRHRDGSVVWASDHGYAIRDSATGRILYCEGTLLDITARKEAEAQVRNHQEHLEDLVAKQTELLSAALARAEEATVEIAIANEAKGAFLATISHEIRTPLNAIVGVADLLLDTPLDVEQKEYVDLFRTSCDLLIALINDVLDFSKIEASQMTLSQVDFDLIDLLEKATEMFAAEAAAKGLELVCDLDHGLPPVVRGDPVRVQQLLVNLLSNAIKFTDRGEVVVRAEPLGEGGMIALAVSDTGIGIPREALERIFDRFTQHDAKAGRRYGGTGLGLAIVRSLAKLMGGDVRVESLPGAGSRFEATLHLGGALAAQQATVQQATVPQATLQQAASAEPIDQTLAGRRILVVDDSAASRLVMGQLLLSRGCSVLEAESGPGGLAQIQATLVGAVPFDAVVLDTLMPGMDGFEVLGRLRELAGPEAPPVVMVTSADLGQARRKAREMGAAALLVKPLRAQSFLATVAGALNRSGLPEAAGPARSTTGELALVDDARPLRVLLAEDSPGNQRVVEAFLRRTPHPLTIASDGAMAVRLAQEGSFDVVLMDMRMPDVDGLEATRRIRAWERESGRTPLKIVALTANAMKEYQDACYQAGCDHFLAKPLRKDTLLTLLRRIGGPDLPALEVRVDPGIWDLVPAYVEETREICSRVLAAAAANDFETCRSLGHDVKGTGGAYGFPYVTELGAALESAAKLGDGATAISVTRKIQTYLASVQMVRDEA